MGIISIVNYDDSYNFLLLFLRLLDRRYQILLYRIHYRVSPCKRVHEGRKHRYSSASRPESLPSPRFLLFQALVQIAFVSTMRLLGIPLVPPPDDADEAEA